MNNKKILIIFIIIYTLWLTMFLSVGLGITADVKFHETNTAIYTLSSMIDELEDTNAALDKYLLDKYGVTNYRKHSSYKYQVCASRIYDCVYLKNYNNFINTNKYLDKYGEFYFGLLQNRDYKYLISSIGQCESAYNIQTVSPDGGYGIFQITPDAIGDPNIKRSKLLDPDYNTQYAVSFVRKVFENAKRSYGIDPMNTHLIQYMTFRLYNGGAKQLDRIYQKPDFDSQEYLLTGDYISSSKYSGRFVCYEKVNQVYPLKVYTTYNTLRLKELNIFK